jgi:DtxR family Mn-dependent transcriptional regulator
LDQQAAEDYLRTIYQLAQSQSPVTTSRIASARQVRPSSVTQMMKRLSEQGLVYYTKHHGVTLTGSGRAKALEMLRRHRLVELYLVNELGFGWDEVHDEADRLEHVISPALEERMAVVLGRPKFDPHGQPIPSKDGVIVALETELLTAVAEGSRVTVARVAEDSNGELLGYLAGLGIMPGAELSVVATAPFDGPLTIKIGNKQKVVGHKAAAKVFIQEQKGD